MAAMQNKHDRRYESRYDVVLAETVAVHVTRDGQQSDECGRLVDLSSHGAKIILPCVVRFSEVVDLRIVCNEADVDCTVKAAIIWVQSRRDGWHAGCTLVDTLPDMVFDCLAEREIIERRGDPRTPVSIKCEARYELGSQAFTVEIVDCSKGGFCMLAHRAAEIGAKVRLNWNHDGEQATIYGQVRWQVAQEHGFLQGCQFAGASQRGKGETLLLDYARSEESELASRFQ